MSNEMKENRQPNGQGDQAGEDEGEYVEVIDLDELMDGEEGAEEGEEGDWIFDEDLETDEVETEEPRPEFLGVEGFNAVEPAVVFSKHTGSVFCLDIDKVTGTAAISGGEDDKAFVWNVENGEVRFVCEGHKDSVTHVGVSHDGVYAFSADMSGFFKVWHMSNGEEVWSTETSDLKWASWHSKAHVLFAATEEGTLYMWQIPSGQCKVQQASASISAAMLFPDGKTLCYGQTDGAVNVFDLKEWKVTQTFPVGRNQEEEVLCLAVNNEGTLVTFGGSSGSLRLLQAHTGRRVWEIDEPAFASAGTEARAIEAVAFSASHPWLFAAGLNGTFCAYDIPTQTRRYMASNGGLKGITKMLLVSKSELVLFAHLNGAVSTWDSRSGTLKKVLFGKQEEILDAVLSSDGLRCLTASNDGNVCVFPLSG